MLKRVVYGGGKDKGQEILMGKFSWGETAYDYEFDDGTSGDVSRGTCMSWLFLEIVKEMLLRAGIVVDDVHIGLLKMVSDLN